MWRFIAGLSAIRNTDCRAGTKIKIVPHVFYDSAVVCNWHDGNKNNLRTIEAQIVQKPKNNKPRKNYCFLQKKRVDFDWSAFMHQYWNFHAAKMQIREKLKQSNCKTKAL